MPQHYLAPNDFDADALQRVLGYAARAEHGDLSLERKILGLLFLSESLRTSSSLKAAMIRAGGGYLGLEGTQGSYLGSKLESVIDTATYISTFSDFLAVRGDVDPEIFRNLPIPVLNAGLGDDHCIVGAWLLYTLSKRFAALEGLRIGVLGLCRYSTAAKSVYRVLSKFGMRFYEDSVVPEASSECDVIQTVSSNNSVFETCPVSKFIGIVDCLLVTDCLSQEGAQDSVVQAFNGKFKTVGPDVISGLKSGATWLYFMPRTTTDGRLTISNELDQHPMLINDSFFRDSVYCNIGILYELSRLSV
jgi:aspartate carbamoyltransferase catalytic subunit